MLCMQATWPQEATPLLACTLFGMPEVQGAPLVPPIRCEGRARGKTSLMVYPQPTPSQAGAARLPPALPRSSAKGGERGVRVGVRTSSMHCTQATRAR